MSHSETMLNDSHEIILAAIEHLDHVLPAQAPIQDFVHHNTLHGYQYLPFEQALAEYEAVTGVSGYLPETDFRACYAKGRITDRNLQAALAHYVELDADKVLFSINGKEVKNQDLYQITLLFDLSAISVSQLTWQLEEMDAMHTLQADVPESVARSYHHPDSIRALWEAILSKLDLPEAAQHPEHLLDLSIEQTEDWLSINHSNVSIHQQMQQAVASELDEFMAQVGNKLSLRGVLLALSGKDILDNVRPKLIRSCAAVMDNGVAAWHIPDAEQQGFYRIWRANTRYDFSLFLHELPDWQQIIEHLPEDALETIHWHLNQMDIPQAMWAGYLQRIALEIPGWSGMINWREKHSNYKTDFNVPIKLADYLAIRLTLDRLWLNQICHDLWKIEGKFSSLYHYFRKNTSEFMVRHRLYQSRLPEYLAHQAKSLTNQISSERSHRQQWQQLADLIWTWQFSPMAETKARHSVFNTGWRLFRLSQHLGLQASHIQLLTVAELQNLLARVDQFSLQERNKVWLYAYEHYYQQKFFNALRANQGRGRWLVRQTRPEAQIIFCMDEREESFRRHLEEFNPAIETLGAAGFFGVAMNYKGLDDHDVTALCPIVVTPAHEVQEIAQANSDSIVEQHQKGRKINQLIRNLLLQSSRINLFLSHVVIDVFAPITLLNLVAKTLLPSKQQRLVAKIARSISPMVPTQLYFTSHENSSATPQQPRLGFTDNEQADRVANLLKVMGLTDIFSSLVVLLGHGSTSLNNPHEAAHDCGACSGRRGGPNARVFAAMANRPEVRQLLSERGITIPNDTWFIGAEHDTCSEHISWFDLDKLPAELQSAFSKLKMELDHTREMSAHERCRRLLSAPRNPTPKQALEHIEGRASDFSQSRPELGHATNAAAVIGRRALTQGAFFDRRVFLISYDPTQDPEGNILEAILLAVGPVGAGINLEYYFSSIDNERFGCSTKVPHNIAGFFGIMEGTSSDLRTGLPLQMTEVHEAMRLQVLVESKTSILERIYEQQPSLQELIAGGWLHLSCQDKDSGDIYVFERGVGFILWQGDVEELAIYEKSPNCYKDSTEPVWPALIKQA